METDPKYEIRSALGFVDDDGNDESMIVRQLDSAQPQDRRDHPNFLAKELRVGSYKCD